jgi:glycosyltransferase involved in cell wall biosynthesis
MRTSILIPSYGRPRMLKRCLAHLNQQSVRPDEVIVVWQEDDAETRDAALDFCDRVNYPLRVLHSAVRGIVPAENVALHSASGEILLLLDDDTSPHSHWIARHLLHYADPAIGAVGAPVRNYNPDGSPYPLRRPAQLGKLRFYGRMIGNLFDHPPEWSARPLIEVDHLAAGNMSLRRSAFSNFEAGLKPYWQAFELDVCLEAKARGFRVMFDCGNSIDHHPTNTLFQQDRIGDLELKVLNAAYNHAFVLSKHSLQPTRAVRILYLLCAGSAAVPGLIGFFAAVQRSRKIWLEFDVLRGAIPSYLAGWAAGSRCRRQSSLAETSSSRSQRFAHSR